MSLGVDFYSACKSVLFFKSMLKSKHYEVYMYVRVYGMTSVQRVKSGFVFVPLVHSVCRSTRTYRACVSNYGTNICQCCEMNKSDNQFS